MRPGVKKFVIFRMSYQVWKLSKKLGYNPVFGDDGLILMSQKKGIRRDRNKDKTIYSKEYQTEKGFVVVYKNKSKNN